MCGTVESICICRGVGVVGRRGLLGNRKVFLGQLGAWAFAVFRQGWWDYRGC